MSLKSLIDKETKVYVELVRSLNRDDITLGDIKIAIEKRKYIIALTPSRFPVADRLVLFQEIIFNELFVGSDVQTKRRRSGELDSLFTKTEETHGSQESPQENSEDRQEAGREADQEEG